MSNLLKIDLLILDSKGIAIKNINVRTKYVNGISFFDEKTNNFGYRIATVSEGRSFEVYVEKPNGEMEYVKTLNSNFSSKNIQKIFIGRPISAYQSKRSSGLNSLKIKLIDLDGLILKNFPIQTGYNKSSKFLNRTTNENGIVEFQASPDRIIEIKSIDLADKFIAIGYFNSNETSIVNVRHKYKLQNFISKTTATIVDIDGTHIYPNAKVKITYNNSSGIKIIKSGLLNITTLIGYPIELTLYKPDNTPLQTKTYVASRVKPSHGFEIRMPVNLTSGTTNPNKPNSTQTAPTGLNIFLTSCIPLYNGEMITEDDYSVAATQLGCEIAAIKAVAQTESPRGAFSTLLGKKAPTILYERHYFRSFTAYKYDVSHPILSGPQGNYGLYSAQYKKLIEAMSISEDAALKSCSWGKFQIMGANFKNCGYSNVKEMVEDAFKNEKMQLNQFVNFINYDPNLVAAIRAKQWTKFAKGYNGPKYYQNAYDTKMKKAYDVFKNNPTKLP
ncbi:N-acetylmuramidase family protein [Acinetobacter bereziniae]|uniref:N-acetylmuramidase family protein n=1 Tax=Acinetobacter bereziniae TaxID=106648 RepID=UPI00124FBF14|nr:N-acetylmuramidase family protein [Acinetobacter bereziniae]MBJ8553051.1 N-acetylmuramidase family protein [Acinetobacter bereziniae]